MSGHQPLLLHSSIFAFKTFHHFRIIIVCTAIIQKLIFQDLHNLKAKFVQFLFTLINSYKKIYELSHGKRALKAYGNSKDSGESAHLCRLA